MILFSDGEEMLRKRWTVGEAVPLQRNGTPVLHARGSEIAKGRLIKGTETGTFPVIIKHPHSTLSVMRDFSESQHWAVGDPPFALLPVR